MGDNGLEVGSLQYIMPLPLIYYGVPLPGKANPYIVLLSKNSGMVIVTISVEEAEKTSSVMIRGAKLGWRYDVAIKSFVDELSARLEQPLRIEIGIGVERLSYPPAASVYAVTTLALVQAISEQGGYELSPQELLQAANDIDQEGGVDLDFVDAMRTALVLKKSIVYRRGEDPVALDIGKEIELELVGEEDIGDDITDKLEDPLYSEITRLLGLNVIEVVNRLRKESPDKEVDLSIYERIENAAYYTLYGANLPDPGCKWVPSLQRVYGICKAGMNLGDRVAFLL